MLPCLLVSELTIYGRDNVENSLYKGKDNGCIKLRISNIWKLLPNLFCGLLLAFLKPAEPGQAHCQQVKKQHKQTAPLRATLLPLLNHSWIQLIFHDHPRSLWAHWCAVSPSTNCPSKASGHDCCLSHKHQWGPSSWDGKMGTMIPVENACIVLQLWPLQIALEELGLRLSQKPALGVCGGEHRVAMPTVMGTGAGQRCHLHGTEMLEGVTTCLPSGRGGPCENPQHTACCASTPFTFEPPLVKSPLALVTSS